MVRVRTWLLKTTTDATTDWINANIEALEQVLVCTVINQSNKDEQHGTLILRFNSPISDAAIRKRMTIGIDQLTPMDGRNKRSADEAFTASPSTCTIGTQTELPAHYNEVVNKIKAMKMRISQLEQANQELKDNNDIHFIASFLD